MVFGVRHLPTLILAVAIVAASTFGRAAVGGEHDQTPREASSGQLSAAAQHGPSWTIHSSDAPRFCPFILPSVPAVPPDLAMPALRLSRGRT
jgi:hypothetical protein